MMQMALRGAGVAWGVMLVLAATGCATTALVPGDGRGSEASVVFGRPVTVLLDRSTRRYQPRVTFFELVNKATQERFRVDLRKDDQVFVVALSAGDYVLSRVQIGEGPFRSMAGFETTFTVEANQIAYLGSWHFGIESPRYERMMVVSVVEDREDREEAERDLLTRHPDLAGRPIASRFPSPRSSEARLQEVMPYPYYPRYFRRHWW